MKRVNQLIIGFSIALGLSVFSACAPRSVEPSSVVDQGEEEEVPEFFHKVTWHGETLGLIAGWYTGNAENWRKIIEKNPGLDVYRMKIGDLIKIPGELMVRTDPLPQSLASKNLAVQSRIEGGEGEAVYGGGDGALSVVSEDVAEQEALDWAEVGSVSEAAKPIERFEIEEAFREPDLRSPVVNPLWPFVDEEPAQVPEEEVDEEELKLREQFLREILRESLEEE